jgi:pyruvate, water dikinase
MGKFTLWLNETKIDDVNLVGGKNASLGEMITNLTGLGINIPNGFVVTTKGYDEFVKFNNLEAEINKIISSVDSDDIVSLKRASSAIQTAIINGEFPEDFKSEIIDYYVELSNKYLDAYGNKQQYTDVAVRSSGTAEDMPDASFAGQQDTYLNVRGKNTILEKIKSCFASLYNERAISYRYSFGYNKISLKLSVCIQKMVRSDLGSAGVSFSIDTESGCKDIILINGSWGLGELVVSGQVKPDEFLVFKETMNDYNSIIDKRMGEKTHKMIYSDIQDKRVRIITNDKYKLNSFCLDNVKIMQLAKWVKIIEDYYSKHYNKYCPIDVEWALDGITNELYIVQARPETVHSNKKSFDLLEYKIDNKQNKELLFTGVSVGDSIGTGKVRIMHNIDTRENDEPFQKGDILVTEITDPDWEPIMKLASGIITEKGGRTCHAAIVARELGKTAIVGTMNCTQILKDKQTVTVSCAEGDIGYVYNGELKYEIIRTDISQLPKINTKLMMNVATPDMAFRFAKIPNCGVGLAREEFIINNFIKVHPLALINYSLLKDKKLKNEIDKLMKGFNSPIDYYIKKLAYGIARIGAAFYPKDVIVRFSDFKSNEYANLLGGSDYEPHEENPMIGWRGASRYYSDNFKEAFALECKAIKLVREKMGLKNVIVMIPFCRTPEECKKVLGIMKENGIERGISGLKVYLMCEIPSNVILAEEFLKHVDGFSIGSNDLTQLTLGLDRDSELVSDIYDERNPAVKAMLSNVIKTCKKLNKKIGICGQGPSDFPDFAEFLIDEGIDTISLTPDSVIKTIKMIHQYEQNKKK